MKLTLAAVLVLLASASVQANPVDHIISGQEIGGEGVRSDAEDNETGDCTRPGEDQYSVIVNNTDAGITFVITNDTRWCSQAGISDPTWQTTD